MVRDIVKDVIFLGQKSCPAQPADQKIGKDLLDTLQYHRAECVGMAANMIGQKKNIIAVNFGLGNLVMYNPVILKRSGAYSTQEGCLSLTGQRQTLRYQTIQVEYRDAAWVLQKQTFTGWPAQIIQHEIDHLEGKII